MAGTAARRPRPPATFARGTGLFLRTLAIVHAIAFASFWSQSAGLVGPHGLLPAVRFLAEARRQLGPSAYWEAPSLCWIFGAGAFLPAACACGLGLSALLFCGFAPALCLALLWALYLSLCSAGQIFYDFQWDALLLETTLVAVFLAPWQWRARLDAVDPPPLARWLAVWLLFRLMVLSGLVKLASGDPTWRHLTALRFHFETQPLPTPVAWYAHHLAPEWQRLACALLFVLEIAVPWALWAPRAWRHPAALALIGLQGLIALTGNYTYFNLLTAALCLPCLDDRWWGRREPIPQTGPARAAASPALSPAPLLTPSPPLTPSPARAHGAAPGDRSGPPPRLLRAFVYVAVLCTALEGLADFIPAVAETPAVGLLAGAVAPFRSLNNYGLFAVMTTERPQLVIEGSDDGHDWREYALPQQPGELRRRPEFVAPAQPRLDWQLWFAALAPPTQNPWVETLAVELLRGNPQVLGLFAGNPFPLHPPHYLRVVRYRYHFTDAAERARTGNWWRRTPDDLYLKPIALR
jgi:hypothetical protein